MKKLIICIILILLCGCSLTNDKEKPLSIEGKITLLDNNGNADTDISNTKLLASGFAYGDSENIKLENGYELKDIPLLSGMYVEYGDPMIYGNANKDKVSFIQKYKSFVDSSNATEEMTYTITLKETEKYKYIEEAGSLVKSDNYDDYKDDYKFANFREIKTGNVKEGRLFRSSSVINNSNNRSKYSARLAINNNINTILNIIDKQEEYDEFVKKLEEEPKKLIDKTTVILAPISNDYQSNKNIDTIIKGLNELIDNDYPYLIHCLEGKDRTGYVFAIIEALCQATYEEIVEDYMISYNNFYGINKDTDPAKYNFIKESNIDAMLNFITNNEINNDTIASKTKEFLINHGMSEEKIDLLITRLCD